MIVIGEPLQSSCLHALHLTHMYTHNALVNYMSYPRLGPSLTDVRHATHVNSRTPVTTLTDNLCKMTHHRVTTVTHIATLCQLPAKQLR